MKYPFTLILFLILALSVWGDGLVPDTGSWPGMGPRICKLAQHLVSTARILFIKEPGQTPRTIWVKRTQRYRKTNGWFGLKVNGEPLVEKYTYLEYQGRIQNLQTMFTLGSGLLDGVEDYELDNLGPRDGLPLKSLPAGD